MEVTRQVRLINTHAEVLSRSAGAEASIARGYSAPKGLETVFWSVFSTGAPRPAPEVPWQPGRAKHDQRPRRDHPGDPMATGGARKGPPKPRNKALYQNLQLEPGEPQQASTSRPTWLRLTSHFSRSCTATGARARELHTRSYDGARPLAP